MPPALPTNNVPRSTVGAANAMTSPGKPKLHFSLRLPIRLPSRPAAAASWKRALSAAGPQPVQAAFDALDMMRVSGLHSALAGGAMSSLPLPMYAATASRSSRRMG